MRRTGKFSGLAPLGDSRQYEWTSMRGLDRTGNFTPSVSVFAGGHRYCRRPGPALILGADAAVTDAILKRREPSGA